MSINISLKNKLSLAVNKALSPVSGVKFCTIHYDNLPATPQLPKNRIRGKETGSPSLSTGQVEIGSEMFGVPLFTGQLQ